MSSRRGCFNRYHKEKCYEPGCKEMAGFTSVFCKKHSAFHKTQNESILGETVEKYQHRQKEFTWFLKKVSSAIG